MTAASNPSRDATAPPDRSAANARSATSTSAIALKLSPQPPRFHRRAFRRLIAEPFDAWLPPRPPFDRPLDDPDTPFLPPDASHCPRCGRSTAPESLSPRGCPACHDQRLPWQRLVRLGPYADPIDEHLKALKFTGHWRLAQPLGQALAAHLPPRSEHTLVTWVPLHWMRRWQRRYDQARLIAEALAAATGHTLLPTLRRTRPTPPQSLLPESRRRANVATAFAPRPLDLTGHRVILVDDVLTTGSTAAACCKLLKKMNAAEITLAVIAVTQRNAKVLK